MLKVYDLSIPASRDDRLLSVIRALGYSTSGRLKTIDPPSFYGPSTRLVMRCSFVVVERAHKRLKTCVNQYVLPKMVKGSRRNAEIYSRECCVP